MANNYKFSNEEKQIFYGDYPLVVESLPLKTTVAAGDVIGVDASGNYGKYDEETYTIPYAVAYAPATHESEDVKCECLLAASLMESFVLLPEEPAKKVKLKQELRKIGLFLK